MDAQYTLRQVINKTDRGKVYRSEEGDWLLWVLRDHELIRYYNPDQPGDEGPHLWVATGFGRVIVDNDHAMREVAMAWMDYLIAEQLDILQNSIADWPFRDPAVLKFMQEINGADGGPTHADFFPQAPWYFHTVGRRQTPKSVRLKEDEKLYVEGGYTGRDFSVAEVLNEE
jgi:hypothetical protein